MALINTNEAKCRDCYKCVRSCPVKAICIKSNDNDTQVHARVIEESCIQDGLCITVCPQKAKVVVSDLGAVKKVLSHRGNLIVASVAPSFPALLPLPEPGILPALLRRLGFSFVGQTAVGAELISREYSRENVPGPVISSACPVVVNLVERHYPHLLPHLSPLVSPMVAHGRLLKRQFPGCTVVFIGPCIAKKGEAMSGEARDAVDFVLGFKEMWEWFEQEGIDLSNISPAAFDGYPPGPARLFPVEGGQLLASSLSTDMVDSRVQTVSGLQNCIELLEHVSEGNLQQRPAFMELLACSGGCLGGPHGVSGEDIFLRKQKLLEFYSRCEQQDEDKSKYEGIPFLPSTDLYRRFQNRKVQRPLPSPEQIEKILAQSGKFSPEDELNCGACGFSSCREKAVAVFQGIAEPQMCIPYMRKRAESVSSLVLRSMPNGVIIANEDLTIVEINPAALKMFGCSYGRLIGEKLDLLVDPAEFQRVFREKRLVETESGYVRNGVITRQIIFPVENTAVGIFIDITNELRQKDELQLVKSQTIKRAKEIIKKQMTVAQEIAGLLGETTAETKVLLNKLISLMKE